jgi:hypothetical protein
MPIAHHSILPPFRCSEGEFECSDETCISLGWKCDRQVDCSDGSDESDCGRYHGSTATI